MTSQGVVTRLRMLIRPVASLQRAVAFYVNGLGFEPLESRRRDDMDAALVAAAYGSSALPSARLRLGQQELSLVEVPASDLPSVPDAGAGDPRFQHIAVIATDMKAAWQRLLKHAPHVAMMTRGDPQSLPAASGGVTAIKFRDPDGHAVELLSYPSYGVPRHWENAAHRAPGSVTIGIDHTAIGVSDTEASIRFWCDALGLTLSARQVNRGVEQEHLDGLPGAVVDVVGLAPTHGTPHIELLGYHLPAGRKHSDAPAGLRGFTVLEVDDLSAVTTRLLRAHEPSTAPRSSLADGVSLAHDPDGHALLLWQPART